MKIRTGFVSYSSSSSFVINLDAISAKLVKQILAHGVKAPKLGMRCDESDAWNVWTTDTQLRGETWMDNFDMERFMREIGVPMKEVKWAEWDAWGA